MVYYTLYLN